MSNENKASRRTARHSVKSVTNENEIKKNQKILENELKEKNIKILSNVSNEKTLENYLKVISTMGTVFYIYLDRKNETNSEKNIKIEETDVVCPVPKSIREGAFQSVSDKVQGVIFEGKEGVCVVIRNPKLEIIQKYYKYKNENEFSLEKDMVFPYPVVYYTNFIFDSVSVSKNINISIKELREVHEKNYFKLLNGLIEKFKRLESPIKNIQNNVREFVKKIKNDLDIIASLTENKTEEIMYNFKLRDDLYRKIITYDEIVEMGNKIDDLTMSLTKENDMIASNHKVLGTFYHKELKG